MSESKKLHSLKTTPAYVFVKAAQTALLAQQTLPQASSRTPVSHHKRNFSDAATLVITEKNSEHHNTTNATPRQKQTPSHRKTKSVNQKMPELNLRKINMASPQISASNTARNFVSGHTTAKSGYFEDEHGDSGALTMIRSSLNTTRAAIGDHNNQGDKRQEEFIKSNPHFKKFNRCLHTLDRKEQIRVGFSHEFYWSDFQKQFNEKMQKSIKREEPKPQDQIKSIFLFINFPFILQ